MKLKDLKNLEFNTISKCQKEYKSIVTNMLDFSGLDSARYKNLLMSLECIFSAVAGGSYDSINKHLKHDYIINAFYSYELERNFDNKSKILEFVLSGGGLYADLVIDGAYKVYYKTMYNTDVNF